MNFLWKLHGNFGCHGNRSWKISNDISYERTEPILMKFQGSIYMLIVQNLVKKNYLSKFKMAAMPIYGKKFKWLLLQNYCAN